MSFKKRNLTEEFMDSMRVMESNEAKKMATFLAQMGLTYKEPEKTVYAPVSVAVPETVEDYENEGTEFVEQEEFAETSSNDEIREL